MFRMWLFLDGPIPSAFATNRFLIMPLGLAAGILTYPFFIIETDCSCEEDATSLMVLENPPLHHLSVFVLWWSFHSPTNLNQYENHVFPSYDLSVTNHSWSLKPTVNHYWPASKHQPSQTRRLTIKSPSINHHQPLSQHLSTIMNHQFALILGQPTHENQPRPTKTRAKTNPAQPSNQSPTTPPAQQVLHLQRCSCLGRSLGTYAGCATDFSPWSTTFWGIRWGSDMDHSKDGGHYWPSFVIIS